MPASAATPDPNNQPPVPDAEVQAIIDQTLAKRELARRQFKHFIGYWAEATNADYMPNWHIDYLSDLLQAVANRDPETRFMIINLPPRFMKSTVAGVLWHAWMIGRDDSPRSGLFSMASSATLAARDSLKTLNILREPWYQRLFPHVVLKKETESEWTTAGGAYRVSAGAEGTVTGRGGPHLLVDDLLQADEADSATIRTKRNEWLGGTLRSRLDDPRRGTITVIQQRLHEDDSTGYLLNLMKTPGADQYRHITIPLIHTAATLHQVSFKGTTYATRIPGDLLHAERIGAEEVAAIKIAQGHKFEAQYQQNPVARDGGFFSADDFQWYDPAELPSITALSWMIGADYATSAKTTSDQSAVIAAGMDHQRPSHLWIHPDSILAHMDPLDAVKKTVALAKRLKTRILGHEKGVIANTLRPLFNQEMAAQNHYLATEAYTRTSGKAVHAAAIKGLGQAKRVHLPRTLRPIWEPLLLRFRPDVDGDKDDLIDGLATIGILVERAVIRPPDPNAPIATDDEEEDDDARWDKIMNSGPEAKTKATHVRFNGTPAKTRKDAE